MGMSVNASGDTASPAHEHSLWSGKTTYYLTAATDAELKDNNWTRGDDGIILDKDGKKVLNDTVDSVKTHDHKFAWTGGGPVDVYSQQVKAEETYAAERYRPREVGMGDLPQVDSVPSMW
jgi:hypothetical protein